MKNKLLFLGFVFAFHACSGIDNPFKAVWGQVTNVTTQVGHGVRDGINAGKGDSQDRARIREERRKEKQLLKEQKRQEKLNRRKGIKTDGDAGANTKKDDDGKSVASSDSTSVPEASASSAADNPGFALYGSSISRQSISGVSKTAESHVEFAEAELARLRKYGLFDSPGWVVRGRELMGSAGRSDGRTNDKLVADYDEYDISNRQWGVVMSGRKSIACQYDQYVRQFRIFESVTAPGLVGVADMMKSGNIGESVAVEIRDWLDEVCMHRIKSLEYWCAIAHVPGTSSEEGKKVLYVQTASKMLSRLFECISNAVSGRSPVVADSKTEEAVKVAMEFLSFRGCLPPCDLGENCEASYVEMSIPYDPTSLDMGMMSGIGCLHSEIEQDVHTVLQFVHQSGLKENPKMKGRAWLPLPIRQGFPVKRICGLDFGQTRNFVERNVAAVETGYVNGQHSFFIYRLKKPFGKFTHATAYYSYPRNPDTDDVRDEEVEALSRVRLEGFVSKEYSRESVIEELLQKKRLIERTFSVDLGVGSEGKDWFAAAIGGRGYVAMGIMETPKSSNFPKLAEGYRLFIEIAYRDRVESPNWTTKRDCSSFQSRVRAARRRLSESQKKSLSVDENDGADAL